MHDVARLGKHPRRDFISSDEAESLIAKLAIKNLPELMAAPDGEKAKQNGADHVGSGMERLSAAHQFQSLNAERGKRREAAADSHHQKLAHGGRERESSRLIRHGSERANDK